MSVARPAIPSRSGRRSESLFALSAYSLILLTRGWGSQRYVRGDDARMLNDALARPWKAILEPYAGYLQVAPRLLIQLVSHLPVNLMPPAIFITSIALWVIAARGIDVLVARLTEEPLRGLAAGVLLLLSPPACVELVGYLDQSLWIMYLLLLTKLVADHPVASRMSPSWVAASVVLILSTPLSVIFFTVLATDWLRMRGASASRVPFVLVASATASLTQLWTTLQQTDRVTSPSFRVMATGIRWWLSSLLPQPLRDQYYRSPGIVYWLTLALCGLLVGGLIVRLRYLGRSDECQYRATAASRILLVCLGVLCFVTFLSPGVHLGYLVIPTGGLVVSILTADAVGCRVLPSFAGTALLGVYLVSCAQSFRPYTSSDIFIGAGGRVLQRLIPWSVALERARAQCISLPASTLISVETAAESGPWTINIPCGRMGPALDSPPS